MKYFFMIEKYGMDKNGNARYKIKGFRETEQEYLMHSYELMPKDEMASIVGRWNKDGKTTNQYTTEILKSIFASFGDHDISYSIY